jgi:hypothetical protein
MRKNLRVYLSGGMEYASNEGRDWRSTLQEWLERELGCSVFNPNHESARFFATHYPAVNFRRMKSENPSLYKTIASGLVDLDCAEIAERTDLLICYWDESAMRGAGTKGELTMAKFFKRPVYMVTAIPREEIPGWVVGCTTELFGTFEELKKHLIDNQTSDV